MDWTTFAREYAGPMKQCAHKIHRRWKMPAGVSPEDVHQEVLLAAWICFHVYDEKRGNMKRESFTMWNAKCAGIAFANRQRNAPRRDCKAHGRFEAGVDHDVLDMYSTMPDQFARVAFASKLKQALGDCRKKARAFDVLMDCSFDTRRAVTKLIETGYERRAAMGTVRDTMRALEASWAA